MATRMAGQAVEDNEEAQASIARAAEANGGIDYGIDAVDKKREDKMAEAERLRGLENPTDLERHGIRHNDKAAERHLRQSTARGVMQETGWDGDISTYDTAAFGKRGFDKKDIKFLRRNGVSDADIQSHIAGLEGDAGKHLRFNKKWGGDHYVGDVTDGDFSNIDFGKRLTKSETKYMRSQGADDQAVYDFAKAFKGEGTNNDKFGYRVHQFFDGFDKSPGETDPTPVDETPTTSPVPETPETPTVTPDPVEPPPGTTTPEAPGGDFNFGDQIGGGYIVGGDQTITVGKTGDQTVNANGATFGDGAVVGVDNSTTTGNVHAGNSITATGRQATGKMDPQLFRRMKLGAFS